MQWTFLDAPQDGTVMLVWQPLAQLGTKFAPDGYIYADAEEVFAHQHRGYVCAFASDAKSYNNVAKLPLADYRSLRT